MMNNLQKNRIMMKKIVSLILAGVVVLIASCSKENAGTVEGPESSEPVYITVSIDPETRATLADEDGAFAFSSGDEIKIFDGTSVKTGSTTSTSGSGSFAMEEGFDASGSGFAGFPACLVSSITADGVKFTLPDHYSFDEVGGSDADAAKVTAPMVGTFTADNSIKLKQAGSLIRFRVTNVAAGSLVFSFRVNVTGTLTNAISTPSGQGDGILAANLSEAGKSITVTDVPEVAEGSYVYITLPVPTNTQPGKISVLNVAANTENHIAYYAGSSTPLVRAGGRKVGIKLTEAPGILNGIFSVNAGEKVYFSKGNLQWSGTDGWRFAPNQYTIVGDNANNNDPTASDGNYLDLFCWGSSGLNGVAPNTEQTYLPSETSLTGSNDWGYNAITNGGANTAVWFTLTDAQWTYLFANHTCRWSSVAGVKGYVIRPDGVSAAIEASYTAESWAAEEAAGSVFLPAAGYRAASWTGSVYVNHVEEANQAGNYWSSVGADEHKACYVYFNESQLYTNTQNLRDRKIGNSVRLVRMANN